MVTRCHGGGRGTEVAGWVRGAEGPGAWRAGALGRFSVGSGDALVIVCVRGCGRGEDQGEVGLRRNCELGSRAARVEVMVPASAIRKVSCPRESGLVA